MSMNTKQPHEKSGYDPTQHEDVLSQARENIRDMRMRDAEIRIVDRQGNPVTGLRVEVNHTRHSFPFGDQLAALHNLYEAGRWNSERAREWRRRFAELFNASNSLCYWTERARNSITRVEPLQGDTRLDGFAATVDWSLASGMQAKGHPLFWSIPKCVPDWAQRYDTATLMKFVEVRVRNLVARFRGKVTMWDAINEPMWEAAPGNLHRRDWPHMEDIEEIVEYVATVLRWCREEDPCATFLVNDYGMFVDKAEGGLQGNDGSTVTAASQRKRYLEMLARLADRGASPGAVGLQSHIGWIDHEKQWEIFDQFAGTGLPVHITEFWANMNEMRDSGRYSEEELEQIEADYVGNYLTCAFGHPAVEAFFFWGLMGRGIAWKGEYAGNATRLVYHRVKDLIHGEWHTQESGVTDSTGMFRFRGFLGHYDVILHGRQGWAGGARFSLDRNSAGPLEIRALDRSGRAPRPG